MYHLCMLFACYLYVNTWIDLHGCVPGLLLVAVDPGTFRYLIGRIRNLFAIPYMDLRGHLGHTWDVLAEEHGNEPGLP